MKFSKLTSLLVSVAMAASATAGLAVTASADELVPDSMPAAEESSAEPGATSDAATEDPAATEGAEVTEKPTTEPCEPLTPLVVEKLPADTLVTFTEGQTITTPTVIETYVAAYAGTYEGQARGIATDTSNKNIGGRDYTTRLKLGGTGVLDANNAPAMRTISVTPAVAGTLVVDFAHASGADKGPREFIAYQNSKIIGSKQVNGGTADTLTVPVAADEPVYLYSGDSGINIYGIKLVTGEVATPGPIEVTPLPLNTRVVFDAGYNAETKVGTTYTEPAVFGSYVAVYPDSSGKTVIDVSNKTIGETKYTTRLKLGGKVAYKANEIPTQRTIGVIPAGDGTLTVDFAHASGNSEAAARTLKAYQNGEEAGTATVEADSTATLTAQVEANVPVYISSPDGEINVYGIILTDGTVTPPTQQPGGEEAKVPCVKITATYSNGILQSAKAEPMEIEPSKAVPSTDGDTKIMYWESLDNMKPVKAKAEEEGPGVDPSETVVPPTTITVGDGATLSANDLEQKEYTETIVKDGFYIGANASQDDSGKNNGSVTVDANNAEIGGVQYTQRIKTGGAGDPKTGVRAFYFKVDSDCTMIMAATSANNEQARDVIVLHGDSEEHLSVLAKASYRVDKINAGETVIIYSSAGALNVYGISLTPYTKAPTYSWKVSDANSACAAGTVLMDGLTTLFEDTAKNGKYITSNDSGDFSNGVASGTALKYVAPKSGTLAVTVNGLGTDKTLYIIADGGELETSLASMPGGGSGVDITISAEVTAETTYYIFAKGSKARFTAASLTEPE